MTRTLKLIGCITALLGTAPGCRSKDADASNPERTKDNQEALQIGYVLHVLNDFSENIRRGAEDAGKDLGVQVDVQGPAGSSAQDAIGIFEGMIHRRVRALAVIPAPGDVWASPIKRALKAGVPIATANITSPDSGASSWFGQNEYQSGTILATELKRILSEKGVNSGPIIAGICAPGVQVLEQRYRGLKRGLSDTQFTLSEPRDVTVPNTTNYATWESLAGANPTAVAFLGLCSMDVPNLAKIKSRSKASFGVFGYDLNRESLDALRNGSAELLLGQHPYLQGYLPVRALVEHVAKQQPLPQGWVDVGTEVITRANVDQVYRRETDPAEGRNWYRKQMNEKFESLSKLAQPLPLDPALK
jgi:ABC-type sugar transport system substrate-binding protein